MTQVHSLRERERVLRYTGTVVLRYRAEPELVVNSRTIYIRTQTPRTEEPLTSLTEARVLGVLLSLDSTTYSTVRLVDLSTTCGFPASARER